MNRALSVVAGALTAATVAAVALVPPAAAAESTAAEGEIPPPIAARMAQATAAANPFVDFSVYSSGDTGSYRGYIFMETRRDIRYSPRYVMICDDVIDGKEVAARIDPDDGRVLDYKDFEYNGFTCSSYLLYYYIRKFRGAWGDAGTRWYAPPPR